MKRTYIYPNNFMKLLLSAHLFVTCFAIAEQHLNEQPFCKEPLTEYTKENWQEKGRCHLESITFLRDANGKKFVLKPQKIESAIHDTLGAHIGSVTNIPINKVKLLPAHTTFMGTILKNAATLHTHAPGVEVSSTKNIPYNVDIQEGLSNKKNLKSISQHKDLCYITALNLYLNNNDNHSANLFFDETTDQFYAIDQGKIFHHAHEIPNINDETYSPYYEKNRILYRIMPSAAIDPSKCSHSLPSEAAEFVEKLRRKKLSLVEIEALTNVKTKLGQLIHEYPAEKIYDEWMNIADKAHYQYSSQKKECIKVLVEHNVYENKKLHSELDNTIKAQNIPYAIRRMAEPGKKAQRDFWHTMNS